MADSITVARPYAKAIFEQALDTKKLANWSKLLCCIVQSVQDERARAFILNPESSPEQQVELLLTVLRAAYKRLLPEAEHLVQLLVDNRRLMLLPEIFCQFESLRAEHEKTVAVQVTSFSKITAKQEKQLVQQLSNRLKRQVSVVVSVDESLLGGAIIQAGDLVIDGSVRGKLTALARTLTE